MKEFMIQIINAEVKKVKQTHESEGLNLTDEEVRLEVFEDLRDLLKGLMSDVSY